MDRVESSASATPADDKAVTEPYAQDVSSVLAGVQSQREGLSSEGAKQRLDQFGPNRLPQTKPTPAWLRLLRQFHNPLLYVLWASALVSLALGHYVDAGVIAAVVIINGLVGFVQEGRAEQALLSILAMAKTQTRVMRNGKRIVVDSETLVPGDVVVLEAGDRVPADMRLMSVKDLQCDESPLTGESLTVDKQTTPLAADTPLAERDNMVFMGTMVRFGNAAGVVTQTGTQTQLGTISTLVQQVGLEQTLLQKQLTRFAQLLTVLIIVLSAAVMGYGLLVQGYDFRTMFQSAIGIAVAAIPEGLPAVVTIALAIGVQRMAKRRALVRQLPAVEVLGSVDVICTDKTGTLTTNQMVARRVVTARRDWQLGSAHHLSSAAQDDALLRRAAQVALLCNEGSVEKDGDEHQLTGDPTDIALLAFALDTGLGDETHRNYPRLDVIPFASERRYMATAHAQPDSQVPLVMVKGAPDTLLEFCQCQQGDDTTQDLDRDYWENQMQALADDGMRVIGLACRELQEGQTDLQPTDVEQGLTLVGLVGIADPPRPEAIDAIASCHTAGIRVKMITGDNPATAAAIGRELGLNAERVLTGKQLEQLSEDEFRQVVDQVDIYARTSPADKLHLVDALQDNGHVVAMTGDGVNDSPALKKANIGVAMGDKGTDAAKEASHFILTDDNFATIVRAIREGRTVYDNIVKAILYVLPTSMAEASVIIAAVFLGSVLPITPVQVLWVNMVTGITLSIALAFELGERSIMQRPPRPPDQSLVTANLVRRLLLIAFCFTVVIFWIFEDYLRQGVSVEYARTVTVNALVLFEVFYLFSSRFLHQFAFHRGSFQHSGALWASIGVVMVLQLGFTYLPASQAIFGLANIGWWDWLWLIVLTAPIIPVIEAEKWLSQRLANWRAGKVT